MTCTDCLFAVTIDHMDACKGIQLLPFADCHCNYAQFLRHKGYYCPNQFERSACIVGKPVFAWQCIDL